MRIATLAVALLLSAACTKTPKVEVDPRTGRTDIDLQKPGEPETWKGTINSVGGSSVSGTASGTTAHDMTMVTVNIVGATPGSTLPWHIHDGKCTDSGAPVVGNATDYPLLAVGTDGRASATAHVGVALNEARNYIINIHASPMNLGTIVACGDYND